jgi:IclR family pca regulon transcriptional regulator
MSGALNENRHVQSLERGLSVLKAFRPGRDRLTIAKVAAICDMPRASARRLLLTLQDLGYVGFDGRQFYLTAGVLELGQGYLTKAVWEKARPLLQALADEFQESVSAGVLAGDDFVYTLRLNPSHRLHLDISPGTRLPAYVCGHGRVMLASLPPFRLRAYLQRTQLHAYTRLTITDKDRLSERLDRVREQGWCYIDGEFDEAYSSIAAPLQNQEEQTFAAISMSSTPRRASQAVMESRMLPALKDVAEKIRNMLQPVSR